MRYYYKIFRCFKRVLFSFRIVRFSSITFSLDNSNFSIKILFSSQANLDLSNLSSKSSTLSTFQVTLAPREENLSTNLFNNGSYKEDEIELDLKIVRTFSTTFSDKETGMHFVLRHVEFCEDAEWCEDPEDMLSV